MEAAEDSLTIFTRKTRGGDFVVTARESLCKLIKRVSAGETLNFILAYTLSLDVFDLNIVEGPLPTIHKGRIQPDALDVS